MKLYQIVLLLAAIYGIYRFIRWLKKPVDRSVYRPDQSRISGYAPGQSGPRSARPAVAPTHTPSGSGGDEFGSSSALGLATGVTLGPNLSAGMLGAAMHQSGNDSCDGSHSADKDVRDHDGDDSRGGSLDSYGGIDSGGSSGGDSGGDGGGGGGE